MQPFFPEDSYTTPADTPRAWQDRLALGSSAYFYWRFLSIVIYSRWQVSQNRYDRAAYAHSTYRVLRALEACTGRFYVTGLDNIRHTEGAVIFVSNHMSALENNVLPCFIAPIKPVTFVVKASLLTYPIFGPLLASQSPIPVQRKNPREDFMLVMKEGQQLLQDGRSLIIYPEGGRRDAFDPQQFNSMGVKLAKKARVPVIPIALKTDFWQNGRLLRDFGTLHRHKPIKIAFGEAVTVTGTGKEAHQYSVDFISSHLRAWGMLN